MDMDEASIISKLESSTSAAGLHAAVSAYLDPLIQLNASKKSKKSQENHQTLLRPLAKKFLPFINRTLSLLPKRLADPSNLNDQFTLQLFDIYRLCLDCLDTVSSVLSGSPYSVHLQRVRMVNCLEACRRYEDTEAEGFRVLERLKAIQPGSNKFLPDGEKGSDKEFASLVGGVVVAVVKCAAMIESKDADVYSRVLCLAKEVIPWFR